MEYASNQRECGSPSVFPTSLILKIWQMLSAFSSCIWKHAHFGIIWNLHCIYPLFLFKPCRLFFFPTASPGVHVSVILLHYCHQLSKDGTAWHLWEHQHQCIVMGVCMSVHMRLGLQLMMIFHISWSANYFFMSFVLKSFKYSHLWIVWSCWAFFALKLATK